MIMDSHYTRAFPHDSFDVEAFKPAVRSYPIQPIELSVPNEQFMGNAGLYNPSLFVDPALIHNVSGAFLAGGAHVPQYGNPTVHPAALHYGNVMPSQAMGGLPAVGFHVSTPNSNGNQPMSFSNVPRASGFSRRTEGTNLGPSRNSGGAVSGGTEPYFCRTQNSSLRQRTAQACEKCRDRKTKCSGERPICKRCSDRGMTCKWAPETRVRGHSRSKASGQIPAAELQGEPMDVLPHPITPLPENASDEELVTDDNAAAASTSRQAGSSGSRRKHSPRGSLSRTMAKKNLAAQRHSWPMVAQPGGLQVGCMMPQTSLQIPIDELSSVDDDSWNNVWARRGPQVDAPIPGRAFDFDSLINASFDYGSGGSSRGSSPPATASTSTSNMSSSFDSLDGISAMLQSQLPAAEDADFTAEMYDLLNLPASNSSSSSSSSGASPASGIFEGEMLMDFANAAKANGGDIANDITPVPQVAMGQDDNYMSQFLSSDFYGLTN